MKRAWRTACGSALALLCVTAPLAARGAEGGSGASADSGQKTLRADDAAATRRELRALAEAWRDGGGRYGYPFWEKAQQRWRAGEISASLFREYVTGYRDRLTLGCELLDSVRIETSTGDDVRDTLATACHERRDGLREQQRWLEELIERDAGGLDADATAALDEQIADHEADARTRFEESWRRTREAMVRGQAALDAAGFDRLREDAFV